MRTFSLGAGADVVKFTLATAGNENNITNFTVSGTNLDKLSFAAEVFDVKSSGIAYQVANGSSTKFADNKIYTGTVEKIKAITTDTSNVNKTSVAIATDTGEIYAITDKGLSSGDKVTVTLIGNVGSDAATAIANGTLSNFIEIA